MFNKSLPQTPFSLSAGKLSSSSHLLFSSRNLEEAGRIVGRIFKPCQVERVDSGKPEEIRMHHIAMGEISLNRLRYGTRVDIAPCLLNDFFLVQMPLAGAARIESAGKIIDSHVQLATVINPDAVTRMRWEPDNDQFMVRISRSLLEKTLIGQRGEALDKPLQFEAGFDWQQSSAWRSLMTYLLECANQGLELDKHQLIKTQIEQLVAVTLLSSHQHNYSENSQQRRAAIRPRHVRRAQEYIDNYAHENITAEQLAQLVGMSQRSLYSGFKAFLGISPMQYLRDVRLDRARAELLSGEVNNVTGVALRWGFAHMGRFSAEYKARYGETPSQSLRK